MTAPDAAARPGLDALVVYTAAAAIRATPSYTDGGEADPVDWADAALRAGLPLILEQLAQRIEAGDPVDAALAGACAWHDAAADIRAFAAEVTT